jgi:hypothetical protein
VLVYTALYPGRPEHTTIATPRARPPRSPLGQHTEAGQRPSIHAVGPSHAEPPFRPSPLAPRASRTWAGRTNHVAAPPVESSLYALHSVTASPAYALTPMADVRDGRDLLPKARAPIKGAKLAAVTTPSRIILYYRLTHSIWSLSDNKEPSR